MAIIIGFHPIDVGSTPIIRSKLNYGQVRRYYISKKLFVWLIAKIVHPNYMEASSASLNIGASLFLPKRLKKKTGYNAVEMHIDSYY